MSTITNMYQLARIGSLIQTESTILTPEVQLNTVYMLIQGQRFGPNNEYNCAYYRMSSSGEPSTCLNYDLVLTALLNKNIVWSISPNGQLQRRDLTTMFLDEYDCPVWADLLSLPVVLQLLDQLLFVVFISGSSLLVYSVKLDTNTSVGALQTALPLIIEPMVRINLPPSNALTLSSVASFGDHFENHHATTALTVRKIMMVKTKQTPLFAIVTENAGHKYRLHLTHSIMDSTIYNTEISTSNCWQIHNRCIALCYPNYIDLFDPIDLKSIGKIRLPLDLWSRPLYIHNSVKKIMVVRLDQTTTHILARFYYVSQLQC